MTMPYTYFAAREGGFIGFFDEYPDWMTEGDTLPELKTMLRALWADAGDLMDKGSTLADLPQGPFFHGIINIPVPQPGREAALA